MFDLAIYVMYERAIVLSESLQLINKFVVIQELFLLLLWSKAYTVHVSLDLGTFLAYRCSLSHSVLRMWS